MSKRELGVVHTTRSKRAAKHFFRKILGQSHVTKPRVITVDKNTTYPPAMSVRTSCHIGVSLL